MKNILFTSLRTVFIIVIIFNFFSCSNDDDLSDLDATIMVRHKNADMPAYIHGNGSEKVFLITLHGGPGSIGLGFRSSSFKSKIEKACAVVYFDQRGSGMSQGSYSENSISIDIMAEDVLALVKVLKHKYGSDSRFFLMGHSWGGALGTATLLKDQNVFLGWVEIDGMHNPKGMYLEYIENFEAVATQQIEDGNSIDFWENTIALVNAVSTEYNEDHFFDMNRKAFKAEQKLIGDNIIKKPRNDSDLLFNYNFITAFSSGGNTQSILIDQGLLETVSYTNRLPEITIPSLVLWGKHDMVLPASFAQEAYDNLGSSIKELVIFEDSGHEPMFSEADLFAETVIQFIDENK
jgi:pimeloyl-ACP methyl ester carboxylesterase